MTAAPPRLPGLATYALLGRSGLRVAPLCLGTMTFGTEWGWGTGEETAFALLDAYVARGGNFLDTADRYTNGTSERILGAWLRERKARDRVVLATKFGFADGDGDPNAGGNGRKHVVRALEASLRRLGTDRVDLYWLHAWDGLTPVEEVLGTLDDLVRAGKILHYGLSDVPAWYLARLATLAETRGRERPIALQLEYSLVERNLEREHVTAALELGVGLCPWSPLASGLLTGKHRREGGRVVGEGRYAKAQDWKSPGFTKLYADRVWRVVDVLGEVARDLGRSPAQVALRWVAGRPGVVSTVVGATRPEQLEENLAALEFELPAELAARLDAAGRPEAVHPYYFFEPEARAGMTGGTTVRREPPGYRPLG